MRFYLYLLLGFLGGVPAGMGMGGGTITIPLLTLVGGVEQKIAQSANLFAFLPMSLLSLSVHKKNGLLETEKIGFVIVPALLSSALGVVGAALIKNDLLRKFFGAFLVCLAVFSILSKKGKQKQK